MTTNKPSEGTTPYFSPGSYTEARNDKELRNAIQKMLAHDDILGKHLKNLVDSLQGSLVDPAKRQEIFSQLYDVSESSKTKQQLTKNLTPIIESSFMLLMKNLSEKIKNDKNFSQFIEKRIAETYAKDKDFVIVFEDGVAKKKTKKGKIDLLTSSERKWLDSILKDFVAKESQGPTEESIEKIKEEAKRVKLFRSRSLSTSEVKKGMEEAWESGSPDKFLNSLLNVKLWGKSDIERAEQKANTSKGILSSGAGALSQSGRFEDLPDNIRYLSEFFDNTTEALKENTDAIKDNTDQSVKLQEEIKLEEEKIPNAIKQAIIEVKDNIIQEKKIEDISAARQTEAEDSANDPNNKIIASLIAGNNVQEEAVKELKKLNKKENKIEVKVEDKDKESNISEELITTAGLGLLTRFFKGSTFLKILPLLGSAGAVVGTAGLGLAIGKTIGDQIVNAWNKSEKEDEKRSEPLRQQAKNLEQDINEKQSITSTRDIDKIQNTSAERIGESVVLRFEIAENYKQKEKLKRIEKIAKHKLASLIARAELERDKGTLDSKESQEQYQNKIQKLSSLSLDELELKKFDLAHSPLHHVSGETKQHIYDRSEIEYMKMISSMRQQYEISTEKLLKRLNYKETIVMPSQSYSNIRPVGLSR